MRTQSAIYLLLVVCLACASRPKIVQGKTRSEWVTRLKSPDQNTRIEAAYTLGAYFGPDAAAEIVPLLKENGAGTRSAAAFALGMCGNSSSVVIGSLEKLLKDEDEIARIDAALAISQLECPKGCADRMLPELILGLRNPRRTVMIASWLRKVGPKAASAVPALTKALSSTDVDTRLNVPLALACVGKAAEPALPRLRELQTTDSVPAVRKNAEDSIRAIETGMQVGRGEPSLAWCR